jgi:hypothetical protein
VGFRTVELVGIRNTCGSLAAGLESESSGPGGVVGGAVIRWPRGGRASGGGCGQSGRPGRQAGQGPGAQGREEIDPVGSGRKLLFTDGVMGGAGNGGRGGLTSSAHLAARRRVPVLATPSPLRRQESCWETVVDIPALNQRSQRMTPPPKQFSRNRGASGKQVPITSNQGE